MKYFWGWMIVQDVHESMKEYNIVFKKDFLWYN